MEKQVFKTGEIVTPEFLNKVQDTINETQSDVDNHYGEFEELVTALMRVFTSNFDTYSVSKDGFTATLDGKSLTIGNGQTSISLKPGNGGIDVSVNGGGGVSVNLNGISFYGPGADGLELKRNLIKIIGALSSSAFPVEIRVNEGKLCIDNPVNIEGVLEVLYKNGKGSLIKSYFTTASIAFFDTISGGSVNDEGAYNTNNHYELSDKGLIFAKNVYGQQCRIYKNSQTNKYDLSGFGAIEGKSLITSVITEGNSGRVYNLALKDYQEFKYPIGSIICLYFENDDNSNIIVECGDGTEGGITGSGYGILTYKPYLFIKLKEMMWRPFAAF